MAEFITWVLLLAMGAWILGTSISIVKTLITRRKARAAGDQNKTNEKECDHSNHS